MRNSIYIPLMTQLTLINKEILHFFLTQQKLFKNLEAICNYILLRDNEFAFNLGSGLAEALENDNLKQLRLVETVVPDAYEITIKVKSLLPESKNKVRTFIYY